MGTATETGGSINLRGNIIRLDDSARLNASGGLGGGYITVGGDLYAGRVFCPMPATWKMAPRGAIAINEALP